MKIVSSSEMREIDRVTSQRFGVLQLALMENAGTAVANFLLRQYSAAKTVGVLCGKGNNGGDGFVAARKLQEMGKDVRTLLLADPAELRGDAKEMFAKLKLSPVIVHSSADFKRDEVRAVFACDVLLDAVLGSGFRPPVSGLYAEAITEMNASRSRVVAVDIPSGADADVMGQQTGAVARADAIVTFTAPRKAHVFGALTAGATVIASIGSPYEAITSTLQLDLITPGDFGEVIAPRLAESNKGNYGHVLVIGGSLGKAGAAAMAGISVLRVGAGLVTVATAKSVLPTVAGFHPEIMTEPLDETAEGTISKAALADIQALAKTRTVLAIGPGISRHPETAELVRDLLKKSEKPVVVDADGLNAFEGQASELTGERHPVVITPHPGEMARLLGCGIPEIQRDRVNVARSFAREHSIIVVLKGHRTLVADPGGSVWVNTTGNPGMSTGGTGDILTGMVAGLVAQNPKHVFKAVIAAVYLHGLAGDVARESLGEQCLIATDLLTYLPEAIRRAERGLREEVVISP